MPPFWQFYRSDAWYVLPVVNSRHGPDYIGLFAPPSTGERTTLTSPSPRKSAGGGGTSQVICSNGNLLRIIDIYEIDNRRRSQPAGGQGRVSLHGDNARHVVQRRDAENPAREDGCPGQPRKARPACEESRAAKSCVQATSANPNRLKTGLPRSPVQSQPTAMQLL